MGSCPDGKRRRDCAVSSLVNLRQKLNSAAATGVLALPCTQTRSYPVFKNRDAVPVKPGRDLSLKEGREIAEMLYETGPKGLEFADAMQLICTWCAIIIM